MARAIAGAGAAKVYIAGRRAEVLNAAAASIGAPPGVVVPVVCDVTSQDNIASLVARIEGDVGYLNLLLCNSGISGPQTPAPVVCLCFDRLFPTGLGGWGGWETGRVGISPLPLHHHSQEEIPRHPSKLILTYLF